MPKLKSLDYPKYDKGFKNVYYKHPDSLLCRLFIMYDLINDKMYRDKAYENIENKENFDLLIKKQLENRSVKYFKEVYLNNIKNIEKLFTLS